MITGKRKIKLKDKETKINRITSKSPSFDDYRNQHQNRFPIRNKSKEYSNIKSTISHSNKKSAYKENTLKSIFNSTSKGDNNPLLEIKKIKNRCHSQTLKSMKPKIPKSKLAKPQKLNPSHINFTKKSHKSQPDTHSLKDIEAVF